MAVQVSVLAAAHWDSRELRRCLCLFSIVRCMPSTSAPTEPPSIAGVRRSFVEARDVRFHVTESGPPDGRSVVALHGWPQHHWVYRDLLADPPTGLRIIAPDLPGYGWSGSAPHRWAKDDVASDILALLDELGLDRVLLVGHDWGGYVGHLMVLRAPERFDGYLALNITHPWLSPRALAPHLWRFLTYQPPIAAFGVPLQRHTRFIERLIFPIGSTRNAIDSATARVYADRFRDPVCARAGRDTYRTFWLREISARARHPETRRATVRSAYSSVSVTSLFISRLRRLRPRTPTTTRSKRWTVGTSSSMSGPTFYVRGWLRLLTKLTLESGNPFRLRSEEPDCPVSAPRRAGSRARTPVPCAGISEASRLPTSG